MVERVRSRRGENLRETAEEYKFIVGAIKCIRHGEDEKGKEKRWRERIFTEVREREAEIEEEKLGSYDKEYHKKNGLKQN